MLERARKIVGNPKHAKLKSLHKRLQRHINELAIQVGEVEQQERGLTKKATTAAQQGRLRDRKTALDQSIAVRDKDCAELRHKLEEALDHEGLPSLGHPTEVIEKFDDPASAFALARSQPTEDDSEESGPEEVPPPDGPPQPEIRPSDS
jgi:predicted RNase H-like nuclease (RuvC/YqgF family)